MRSGNLLPVLLVGLCAGFVAVPASASSLCHEDEGARASEEVATPGAALEKPALEKPALEEAALEEAALEVEELILPCAMVESDQLGPWCVDAAVYLVTTKGTLLCRVSLPAVDLATADSSDIEDRDPAPAPSRTQLPAPAASIASAVENAWRPLVSGVASSLDWLQHKPHPVYAEPPFVPG